MIEIWFDGICEPVNPGGYGAYGIYIVRDGKDLIKEGIFVGKGKAMSNNVAEYSGFFHALNFLKDRGLEEEEIIIKGDSKLVIEQMSGNWRIKQGLYVELARKVVFQLRGFKKLRLCWIPREENGLCDSLARDVLRKMGVKFKIQPDK